MNISTFQKLAPIGFASVFAGIACGDSSAGTGGAATTVTGAGVTSGLATTTTNATSTTGAQSSSASGQGGAGEPSCATTGKNFLLCDDFEAQAAGDPPDAAVWTVDKGANATALIDGGEHRFGQRSLHLHTQSASSKALLHETKTFPLPGGTKSFYGRAFFKLKNGLPLPPKHTNLFEGDGTVGNGMGNYRYGESGGKFLANYNPGDPTKGSATQVPVGSWSCFEWAFLGDTNEMHFYVDETELTDVAVPPTGVNGTVWTSPDFSSAYFGWITYEADPTGPDYDIWYDNIAIDLARIHCDK